MQYSKEFIKELEQLSFHVNNHSDTPRPLNWQRLRTYENFKTGFYAESFVNKKGIRVLVFAGTNPLSIKDDWNDWKMLIKKIPMQADDAFKTYQNFQNRYEKPIIVVGYSLGGSLAQIVCNETGANGITFAAYGVGDIVEPKNTNQIINYGNENDPIFKKIYSTSWVRII